MYDFSNRVALVTGGASGIGRAAAEMFAKAGASVIIADAKPDADEALETIARIGGEARFMTIDVSQSDQVEDMVRFAVAEFGRLDFAFNNAGVAHKRQSIVDMSEEMMRSVLDVNLVGVWLCMKYQIRQMREQGGTAAIVNNSSIGGLIGTPEMSPYVMSKHAVIGMTRSVALECARSGIRVNAVCPGYTSTPMFSGFMESTAAVHAAAEVQPMGRYATPTDIASAVLWLCSDGAAYVTGIPLPVDGGFTAR